MIVGGWRILRAAAMGSLVAGLTASAPAYELRTHEKITAKAFEASDRLKVYLQDVGIHPSDTFDRENRTEPNQLAGFDNTGTPRDWMIEGAIREDDYRRHPGCREPENPPSEIDRPLHHFLDVQRGGRGLTVLGLEHGLPAPDWALGRRGRGPEPARNRFSLPDARVYQLGSLTAAAPEERERQTALLFRALGHVVHVLEDMAQPQHTRNDPHAGCVPEVLAGGRSWFEEYMETRARGASFRGRALPSPALSLEGYPPVPLQGYGAFWSNAGQTGLADFSSLNFLSAGTNLGGGCGGLLEPPCDPEAYGWRDVPFSVLTARGTTLAGTVRLFTRGMRDPVTGAAVTTRDPVTGEATEEVAVTSRSLWDQHLERQGRAPAFSMNVLNYDAIGDALLPRAVGYAAGLLDHFFRGRLDVDLVSGDEEDPAIVRVAGVNASPEDLGEGTLTLFWDDPATGERAEAPALDPSLAVTAAAGAPVESARFLLPGPAERFMAVYRGSLGEERPEADAPGAVIGKVLGGVRVEQVFLGAERWGLRTPTGVFRLPLTVEEVDDVRWGDGEDVLVARAAFRPEDPIRVAAYRLHRREGSVEPEITDTADGPEVRLTKVAEAAFPFGMPPIATVHLSQQVRYRQQVVKWSRTFVLRWVPSRRAYDEPLPTEYGPYAVETVSSQTVSFAQSFPVVLDRAHHRLFGASRAPYVWDLAEVAADASGRLLGVVVVHLTAPTVPAERVPTYNVNPEGGLAVADEVPISPRFPPGAGPIWALVDLGAGRLLASTAEPALSLSLQMQVEGPPWGSLSSPLTLGMAFQDLHRLEGGGPLDGLYDFGWVPATPVRQPPSLGPPAEVTELQSEEGTLGLAVDGALRPELGDELSRALGEVELGTARGDPIQVYDNCSGNEAESCRVLWLVPSVGVVRRVPPTLQSPVRSRPAPGAERLVFQASGGALVVWDPESPSARVVVREGGWPIEATSRTLLALDLSGEAPGASSLLVPLEGARPPVRFPGEVLPSSFRLLEPGYLYNVDDLRFYAGRPPLRPTALPARLAEFPDGAHPWGDYHAVRLPAGGGATR
jgi:hypothetical protein